MLTGSATRGRASLSFERMIHDGFDAAPDEPRAVDAGPAGVVPARSRSRSLGVAAATAITTAWLLFVVLVLAGVLAAGLVAATIAVLAAGSLIYLRLWRRHRDLQRVHRFVAERFGDHEIAGQAVLRDAASPATELAAGAELLERIREFMGAESAELVVDDDRGRLTRVRVQASRSAPANESDLECAGATADACIVQESGVAAADWPLLRVRQQAEPLLASATTRDRALARWLAATGTREAILTPVREGVGDPILILRNRLAVDGRFGRREVVQLEALADHFAHALHTSRMLYRLRYEATHDPLTGLSNRTVLAEQLDIELSAAADRGRERQRRGTAPGPQPVQGGQRHARSPRRRRPAPGRRPAPAQRASGVGDDRPARGRRVLDRADRPHRRRRTGT